MVPPPPPPASPVAERVCVCLSGRVVQPDKLAACWNGFAETHAVDFVGHVWRGTALPAKMTFVMTDTRQDNSLLLPHLAYPKNIPNFIVVTGVNPDDNNVGRINSQLCGVAAAHSMGVLYGACTGVRYKWFVRARFDFQQLHFDPAVCRADLHFQHHPESSTFVNDFFYFGKPEAMRRICLAYDNWQTDILELAQPLDMNEIILRLVGLGFT
jgi:hypothetical protein